MPWLCLDRPLAELNPSSVPFVPIFSVGICLDPNHKGGLQLEFTVDDPKMYTKPWTNARPLTPLKTTPGLPDLLEYNCEENNKDLQHLMPNKPALQP